MRKSRKVCLFVVEGMADKTSLALPLQNLFRHFFDPAYVEFDIMNGDITADYRTKPDTIIGQLGSHIKKHLDKKKLKFDDLIQIILVVDTDGAFIPDDHVIVGARAYRKYPFYLDDSIVTANLEEQEKIQVRNHRKVSNLKRIIFLPKVRKIPFCVYYFSCNMDHVFHNDANLDDDHKVSMAENIEDKFRGNYKGFIDYLRNSFPKGVKWSYDSSWSFIEQGTNSLKRNSNFVLFLDLDGLSQLKQNVEK
ncbi:hypothetical protein [Dialister sp.]|jgi:hypothetical protein|uniref:hypothetical protein n=1 Tax=Dialister sp. TaxID=1955814 RepID=UPI003A5BD32A